jgi:hypothetical protein
MGQLVEAFGYFDEARQCVVRVMGPAHRHPFIGLCRSSDLLLAWWFCFDPCIFLVRPLWLFIKKNCMHPLDAEAGGMPSILKKTTLKHLLLTKSLYARYIRDNYLSQ